MFDPETALANLRALMVGIQRARSIERETSGLDEATLAQWFPALFGEKNPLPLIVRAIEDHEAGRQALSAHNYANLIYATYLVYTACPTPLLAARRDRRELPTLDNYAAHCLDVLGATACTV